MIKEKIFNNLNKFIKIKTTKIKFIITKIMRMK